MMPFNFTNYAALPVPKSPMNAMLAKALDNYHKGINLSYLPREKEANIFAKGIGPVAQLAASPAFKGFNPQQSEAIANAVGQFFGVPTGDAASEGPPGYPRASKIQHDLEENAGAVLGPGAIWNLMKSNLASGAEKLDLPGVSNYLGGSKLAQQAAKFEQTRQEAMANEEQRGTPHNVAKKIYEIAPGENTQGYVSRTKPRLIKDNTSTEPPIRSLEDKLARDEQEKADADATVDYLNKNGIKATPQQVLMAQGAGVKTIEQFKQFLKKNK